MNKELKMSGLKLIQNKVFKDDRGYFVEHYRKDLFTEHGLPEFIQDNHSRSKPGVIRGLHFQSGSTAQGKLVSVIQGRIWDVVVDLRNGSNTYGQWEAVELSEENALQLWIPQGFAHGFCVLGDTDAHVLYKVDRPYSPGSEGGIVYSDPNLNIRWPVKNPILSEKDLKLPLFESKIEL
jgi:dTDP-4-dehydrorhamnose 3,5-epimerase